MIDPSTQAEILRYHFVEKLSIRAIALRFGVHRQTVTALIKRREVLLNKNSGAKRVSILAPYYDRIDQYLREDPGRSSINILQKLRDMGYQGGITILKDYLSTRRISTEPKAYLSLEFLPGQAAQVDWGDFGDPFGLGRKLWCFVMVLCWSRLLYLEFTHSACFESFIRCHEHAFEYFGGIPKEIWYDNLATAVAERKHKIVRFNPKFLAYCGANHYKPVACNRAAGHEKGRVEDGVRYVRHNFWPGRSFVNLDDTNNQIKSWQNNYANKRTHATTHKIPELQFIDEKSCLLPQSLNYDTDEIRSLKASHQFRIQFDSNEYSVPWRLVGRILTLRANTKIVKIYLNTKHICTHTRCWGRKQSIVNPKHQEGLLERKPGAQTTSDIAALKALGPNACRYLEFIGVQNRSIRTELNHLMVLITVYGPQALEACIAQSLKSSIIGSHHLERLLIQSEKSVKPNPEPLNLNDQRLHITPYIPNLSSYDTLLFDNHRKDCD